MDEDLERTAAAYGVWTSYVDWRGRTVPAPRETVAAVLEALGVSPGETRPAPDGTPPRTPAVDPDRILAGRRLWGFMTQLYSVRSSASWGLGDLRDLAELARWSARDLGAGFVLVNPLHAGEPSSPLSPSPYRPVSRRFANPLYLRVEDVPEYAALGPDDRRVIDELGAGLRKRNRTLDDLDRDAVWDAKRAALEILYRAPRPPDREAAYTAFRRREGEALTRFATWCVLAEEHGSDWRSWPARLQAPETAAAGEAAKDFHAWLQWQLDEQLGAAQRAATDTGMRVGIIHDLAVGVHPGGADAWMHAEMLARRMSVGAPPDEFNQRGQDWGQPPWHPQRLAAAGYRPFREMIRYCLRHAGGLRLDHAMQLSRLWWIPEGASPAEGTYVSYPLSGMLGALVEEARAAGALLVGEDLGTVEDGLREAMAASGMLGTSMLWFEREQDGALRPPDKWRELCLATVGTHDMPPIAGYVDGDHVRLRERLGLLTRSAADERADHEGQLAQILAGVDAAGLGTGAGEGDRAVEAVARELHGFLARTPARLIGVALTDAVGERRTQNQPGTTDEYPNWRVPLADDTGHPVLLEDLPSSSRLHATIAPIREALNHDLSTGPSL